MKKAITVLGLGAAAVAISVSNASAMETAHTTSSVNLREQPSATSNKISKLQPGEQVTIIGKSNGWANIKKSNGQNGWVSGYYVTNNEENIKVENKNIEEKKVSNYTESAIQSNAKLTSTSFLNVRTEPSTSGNVLGKIYKGEIFKVISRSSNGWYKVSLNDGTQGWASGNYIALTSEKDNTNIGNVKKSNAQDLISSYSVGYVNSSVGLNVRSGAGTNNAVISTLSNNERVSIVGEDNGWYKIQLSDGSIGYVGGSYISKGEPSTAKNQDFGNVKKSSENVDSASSSTNNNTNSVSGGSVVKVAESLLGTKYVWGGSSTSGFDCSGFTQYVYKNALGISIPRVSGAQATAGTAVSMNNIKAGDLLYFDTAGSGRTSHVGIYLGNGKFIHASGTASNPEYVKVSNLSEGWVKCLGARRF